MFLARRGTTPPTSGGCAVLRGISRFGVNAAGEIYRINHSAGTIPKVVAAPAAPTNVRISAVRSKTGV